MAIFVLERDAFGRKQLLHLGFILIREVVRTNFQFLLTRLNFFALDIKDFLNILSKLFLQLLMLDQRLLRIDSFPTVPFLPRACSVSVALNSSVDSSMKPLSGVNILESDTDVIILICFFAEFRLVYVKLFQRTFFNFSHGIDAS